jgi:hypothetical protein
MMYVVVLVAVLLGGGLLLGLLYWGLSRAEAVREPRR